ncbi:MAG: hypothetical protein AB7P69_20145 [Candidatus Binatia bacterium]
MSFPREYFTGARSWRVLTCVVLILSLVLFQTSNVLLAQTESSQPPQTVTTPPPAGNDKVAEDLQRLTNRVLQLEIDLAKASKGLGETNWVTAIVVGSPTLVAALIAGLLTLLSAYFTAKREERRAELTAQRSLELARQEAVFSHTEKILEFRLKQMELFYAPMFALLEQSRALYDKMLYQLVEDEPERYKLLTGPDPEGYRMHVRAQDGDWKGFRLLDQFPAVKTNQKALTLAEQILHIGDQITKIISDRAGLASNDLIDLLGEYLAHHAVLSAVHKLRDTAPAKPGGHKILYYPRELNKKIEEGYRELNQFIGEYATASRNMLKALPNVKRD